MVELLYLRRLVHSLRRKVNDTKLKKGKERISKDTSWEREENNLYETVKLTS